MNTSKNRTEQFREIVLEMADTYEKKNADYGNSFGETFAEVGVISAYTRISDKFNRFKAGVIGGKTPNFESMADTLLDLACYAIMTSIELRETAPSDILKPSVLTPAEEERSKAVKKFLDEARKKTTPWADHSWADKFYKKPYMIGDIFPNPYDICDSGGCQADEPVTTPPTGGSNVDYGTCSCGEKHEGKKP